MIDRKKQNFADDSQNVIRINYKNELLKGKMYFEKIFFPV